MPPMKSNLVLAMVTAVALMLTYSLWRVPDPFSDTNARFLDRFGIVTELGGQMQLLFPDAVIVSELSAVRCIKKPNHLFGQRQVIRADGDVIEYQQWRWCWR